MSRAIHVAGGTTPFVAQLYLVITGARDDLGRASFTIYWREEGGKGRAQCFRAVPEDYIKRGAILVDDEARAKLLAWGES